jgi:hypothetical protein
VSIASFLTIVIPIAFTLFIITLAYGDNPLYEFGAYLLIGSSAGWTTVQIINFLGKSAWTPTITGKPWYALSILLGLALFTRFIPQYRWIYRYPMAIIIGTGTGLAINGAIGAQIVKQMTANFMPIFSGDAITIISNLIIIIGSMTSLAYFLFTENLRKGPLMSIGKIGRYVIMGALGATFGSVMTFRINALIGRIDFLAKPGNVNYSIVIAILCLVVVIAWDKFLKKE